MLKIVEDFLKWLVDHWQDLTVQTCITSLAVIIVKQVGIKQVKRMLHTCLPQYFKEDDTTMIHLKAQTDIVKGLHEKIIHLERESVESRRYVERTLREMNMKLGNKN